MKLAFQTDGGIGTRANLGVIVLETDETLEHEFRQIMTAPGLAFYVSRIAMAPQVSSDNLARMEADLPASARLLPPSLSYDAIGFGCTSAASVIGSQRVADAVTSVCPGAKVTDPLAAIVAALHVVGARRIGFVTPYVAEVSARMRQRLEATGFQIVSFGSFEEGSDPVVARITPQSVFQAITDVVAQAPCDAVVVACTNLRCLDILAQAEAAVGCPVISSNQALAWHLLNLAGVGRDQPRFGHLFRKWPKA